LQFNQALVYILLVAVIIKLLLGAWVDAGVIFGVVLLNCRSLRFSMFRLELFSNPWIWGGVAAMTVAQLLFTYAPLMNRMFHTAPIGLMDWGHILAVGVVIYVVIGAEKTLRQRWETRGSQSMKTILSAFFWVTLYLVLSP
jgi:magnesium-transporting ATPase (P-type)